MNQSDILDLSEETRIALWKRLVELIEDYLTTVSNDRVTPELNPKKLRSFLEELDFKQANEPVHALEIISQTLRENQTNTPHPRYFGLFNPKPTVMGIAADAIVATLNPQLAAWSHSPMAIEMEQYLIRAIGKKFGYQADSIDGTFTSGGAEANHTAILTALVQKFADFREKGLRALPSQPTLYVSSESHHSFLKAARLCGLGTDSVRIIPVDQSLRIDISQLEKQLSDDKRNGYSPFLLVANVGTTNAGVIDPVRELADIAKNEDLWFHVDAAWGGAAALVPELRYLLEGTGSSDSFTFDAHKFMSVPMGAGIYVTSHTDILNRTFSMPNNYMPKEAAGLDVIDPFQHSIQWSRRFIGLKVFLSVMVAGWDGYADVIRHQVQMGKLMREELEKNQWTILNDTCLPVVCFADSQHENNTLQKHHEEIVSEIVRSGEAWISTTKLNGNIPVIRACITNYRTQPDDVHYLVNLLNEVRKKITANTA